jgi:hypothetical protein
MTTYLVLQARGLERHERGPGDSEGLPLFRQIATREAHGPEAAALAAAEDSPHLIDDGGGGLIAVPIRNWHTAVIEPTRGFRLAPPEGSLLDPDGDHS